MKLVTGNDLKTGAVTWWTGDGWSTLIEDAVAEAWRTAYAPVAEGS